MKPVLPFFLLLSISFSAFGQHVKIKPSGFTASSASAIASKETTPLFKSLEPVATGDKWAFSLKAVSARKHFREEIKAIKEQKMIQKLNSASVIKEEESGTRGVIPVVGTDFEANWSIESTPPDNTMAISNGGFIVTANNDGIEYYNAGGSFLYFDFWFDFLNDNSLTSTIYDPRVIYDSGADRFVLVILHGSTPSTSKVLVCFSKTNDPQNGWWVYTLTGNPLSNNCWFDYPALAVSNNEVYVTGNLFNGNSFNQAVIYQIPKAAGYAGQSLEWQYWAGLSNTPFEAFSLVPASWGQQGNYGPGVYLVSSEYIGSDKLVLWDLTDDMSGSPELVNYTIQTDIYSPAADAFQSGSSDALDNGDCRMQSAFYFNGILHYVFHTDIGEGWNGIYYGRMDVEDGTNETTTFGLQGSYDYSYPSVASFSTSSSDPSVMVAFLRSSQDSYPEVRVVNCDRFYQWSPSTRVKAGETFVDFLSDDLERWGDYTGMSRRHNSADPRVWLSGAYGANIPSQAINNTYKTWVAEIQAGESVAVQEQSIIHEARLFPNPAYDLFQMRFTLPSSIPITVELADAEGKMLKSLYRDTPKAGENLLSFNKGVLSAGTYFLVIRSSSQILYNEKLVILD